MDVDMDQIWNTIFSGEPTGIIILIVTGLIVFYVIYRLGKVFLLLVTLITLAIVGYVFFPGLFDSALEWFRNDQTK
ncbi:MAG: hypothetical protein DF168_01678 [Candidatus Moanabacter tarae]|uniref:Uncharacterized protein n=1 Tax=Candidatus Moanibacter tarae TaxID=2200854 RepID=A0A2Z4AJ60_9BACT|nr:MAG: hypothetical protein DF168_01678 [Candidatus Moanabacter tarae]|tara:strand:- start:2449 stop:2676 length:228 start_codon:yes stop_codon:yes gene_type:complete